jgi:predicted unusual protein kinase regulating ubiquinone biosynthesis (AarF/ABC1/UbiB family)
VYTLHSYRAFTPQLTIVDDNLSSSLLSYIPIGWYLGLLWDKAWGINDDVDVQKKRGAELREHFVTSKSVALIKSGQALSLRPDLIRNRYWAEELGKLVDAVGAFPDTQAMEIMRFELKGLMPRLEVSKLTWQAEANERKKRRKGGMQNQLQKLVESDPILSLFEFYNDYRAVASASIGQVYKARIRRGKQLEAAIGPEQAAIWGGKVVAVKVQRPDVEASASLDMYLLRRTAMWLSKVRGGNLPKVADAFGMQLFGELDYVREANNCDRFRELYGYWDDIEIPETCSVLTRRRVLVMSWLDGEKGPWPGQDGIDIVRIGLRCSVDQLMTTGLFHAGRFRQLLLLLLLLLCCCLSVLYCLTAFRPLQCSL